MTDDSTYMHHTAKTTREQPNAETLAAMNEYYEMKEHPENYRRYSTFREAMNEVNDSKLLEIAAAPRSARKRTFCCNQSTADVNV